MSVVWTSRLAGIPFPERVTGVDLMARLLEAASDARAARLPPGRAARRGARAGPALRPRATRARSSPAPATATSGRPSTRPWPRRSGAAAPHMLFVGMPSPFKETWCERHRAALDVPVIMGVGGTLRRAGRLRAPRPARAPGAGARVGLAAGHGAAPHVEALPASPTRNTCSWRRGAILRRRAGSRGTPDERRAPAGRRPRGRSPCSWAPVPKASRWRRWSPRCGTPATSTAAWSPPGSTARCSSRSPTSSASASTPTSA